MSWFEMCMIVLGLLAAGLGGHAVGYARGRISREVANRAVRMSLHIAWEQGWNASERFGYPVDPEDSFENPYKLTPNQQKIVNEMTNKEKNQ